VNANYELISDNLLDLSHVEYLHPDFARREGFGNFKSEMVRDGNTITAYLWKPNSPITAFQRMLWDTTSERATVTFTCDGILRRFCISTLA